MSLVLELRRRGRHVFGSIAAALVVAYFLFHAVQGERGVLAWIQLKQQVAEAEAALQETRATRRAWEARIAALRSESLDPDLLDERARIVAGLGREGEIIVFDDGRATAP